MQHHDLLISPEKLFAKLEQPDLCVVDCRFNLLQPGAGRASFLQAHIPGAVYANLDDDLSGPLRPDSGRHPLPEPSDLARTFGNLGIANDTTVVAYDDATGALAARAWWLLRWLGHTRVAVLDGGMSCWQALGLPCDSGEARPLHRQLSATRGSGRVLTSADIVANLRAADSFCLVDAREPDRFSGEREPIDPVAGHIPGARNLPCAWNIAANGRWKSGAELREVWARVVPDAPRPPVGVMCGSGVTACQLVLSGLLAGLAEPGLYAGSWSEWIRDPRLPKALGPAARQAEN